MKAKIIQADTRHIKLYLESRNLNYGPPDQMNFGLIASLNNNILIQPNNPNSIAHMINLIKSKFSGFEYEFVLGNQLDWEQKGVKANTWIKIHTLMSQMKDSKNSHIELFCFIDSDAWIRDEKEFVAFCQDFMNRKEHIALPRDIEVNNASYLNSGFIAVKNTEHGYHILDTIYNHPDYRDKELLAWWEQSQLSNYNERHPGEIYVLPMNDFNTPCGRIVRHCWTKHLIEPFVIEEAVALLTRIGLSFTSDSRLCIGSNIQVAPPS
jgi:hypothetical protein